MKFGMIAILCGVLFAAQDSPLVTAARSTHRPPIAPAFQTAPPLSVVRWYNSPPISIEKARGEVLLLDFWATWCGSCVREQPKIAELARRFSNRQFQVVLVHARYTHRFETAPGQAPKLVLVPAERILPQFLTEHRITLPVAVAGEKDFAAYGVEPIPHYFLVDKAGKIRYDAAGKIPTEVDIQKLLDESCCSTP